MITTEQRKQELHELLEVIKTKCEENDLRVGQLFYIVSLVEDLFSIENNHLQRKIEQFIK